jgi:hypothetical protein
MCPSSKHIGVRTSADDDAERGYGKKGDVRFRLCQGPLDKQKQNTVPVRARALQNADRSRRIRRQSRAGHRVIAIVIAVPDFNSGATIAMQSFPSAQVSGSFPPSHSINMYPTRKTSPIPIPIPIPISLPPLPPRAPFCVSMKCIPILRSRTPQTSTNDSPRHHRTNLYSWTVGSRSVVRLHYVSFSICRSLGFGADFEFGVVRGMRWAVARVDVSFGVDLVFGIAVGPWMVRGRGVRA